MIKKILRNLINRSRVATRLYLHFQMLKPTFWGRKWCSKQKWSQGIEDSWLANELSNIVPNGYYVDIGANHPSLLSNTFRLYNLGMSGICIEPNEILCQMHELYRPRDEVLCIAVGPTDGLSKFYVLNNHVFSTFSKEDCDHRVNAGMKLVRATHKPIFKLSTILEGYVGRFNGDFSLLSVDVEGWDIQVLQSNDWERFRPRYVVVEANTPIAEKENEAFLLEQGYELRVTSECNGIFMDMRARK